MSDIYPWAEKIMSILYQEGVKPGRYSVYKLINPFNQEPFYIGYTSDVTARLRSHLKGPPESNSPQGRVRWQLISSILRNGKRVTMEVVATYAYQGDAMRLESRIIKTALEEGGRVLNANVKSLNDILTYQLGCIANFDRSNS